MRVRLSKNAIFKTSTGLLHEEYVYIKPTQVAVGGEPLEKTG